MIADHRESSFDIEPAGTSVLFRKTIRRPGPPVKADTRLGTGYSARVPVFLFLCCVVSLPLRGCRSWEVFGGTVEQAGEPVLLRLSSFSVIGASCINTSVPSLDSGRSTFGIACESAYYLLLLTDSFWKADVKTVRVTVQQGRECDRSAGRNSSWWGKKPEWRKSGKRCPSRTLSGCSGKRSILLCFFAPSSILKRDYSGISSPQKPFKGN